MSSQAKDLLLGAGRLYFKRVGDPDGNYRFVGVTKGESMFTYSPELVEQKPGDTLGPVRRDKVDEHVTLKISVVDFKVSQLVAALGLTVSTTQLTNTHSMRIVEEIDSGSITGTKTLSRTAKTITSVHVTSLDRGTDFATGTDYTMAATTGITPLTAGFANTTHAVHYTHLFTTERVGIGNNPKLEVVSVMFVHERSNGKSIAITLPRATIGGDLAIPFQEKEYTVQDVTFSALVDPNVAKGKSLAFITDET